MKHLKKYGEVNEDSNKNVIEIDGKKVNVDSIRVGGIDHKDYPDYCDAYAEYAEFEDGTELTEDQLEKLTSDYSGTIQSLITDNQLGAPDEDYGKER